MFFEEGKRVGFPNVPRSRAKRGKKASIFARREKRGGGNSEEKKKEERA